MSFDGDIETEFILSDAGIGTLAGRQVFETGVPDDIVLQRYTDGKTKPYIIVRFADPFASTQSRAVGAAETAQPHVLTFTVVIYGGKAGDVRKTANAVKARLVGTRPSPTASDIKASGGFSYAQAKTDTSPTRFERGMFFRCFINL